jgi:hypothetical protein
MTCHLISDEGKENEDRDMKYRNKYERNKEMKVREAMKEVTNKKNHETKKKHGIKKMSMTQPNK